MQIDLYHDTVCPWCRIGKRHLDLALDQWDGEPPTVRWRPFFLDETVPTDGLDFHAYMRERKGLTDLEPMFAVVQKIGSPLGLTFRFDRVQRAVNTLRSHQLIALTPEPLQGDIVDAMHRAYFEDGRDIGAVATLTEIATASGLDGDDIASQLHDDARADRVRAEAAVAQARGVSGVPLFVIADHLMVSGARPAADLLAAMEMAASRQPSPA